MTRDLVLAKVTEAGAGFTFVLDGKTCGMEYEGSSGRFVYTLWYGEAIREYRDPELMMADRFFGGRSLNELIDAGIALDFF
ncbi:hypothetical protein [Lacticaseibacillus kribbianus]|uniref:hypothetical protein n=1 Tax=Lacticaseibacillus kribbianus TaxID=2926292 RepID=UPI001CD46AE0|nr:hypothetical protein [Lacticaseibacillus kribbianus]